MQLGYAFRLLELGRHFETKLDTEEWQPDPLNVASLYNDIALAYASLGNTVERLNYRNKHYEYTEKTCQEELILRSGSALIEARANTGILNQAKQLEALSNFTNSISENRHLVFYNLALGAQALMKGEYKNAILHYRKSLHPATPYNQTVSRVSLCECLARHGDLINANKELAHALHDAERHHLFRLLPSIFSLFTHLSLYAGDIKSARKYETTRKKVMEKVEGNPFQPDPFLLLAEKRWDEAITESIPDLSTEHDEKIDKDSEITALIVLARAWHGKGDSDRAQDFLERARVLMDHTGCRRERDRFEQTEATLKG